MTMWYESLALLPPDFLDANRSICLSCLLLDFFSPPSFSPPYLHLVELALEVCIILRKSGVHQAGFHRQNFST